MLKMQRYWLLGTMVLALSATAKAETYDCQTEPGAGLCRSIRLTSSYLVSCSGGGCDRLIRRQIRYFNETADYYYGYLTPGPAVGADLARAAYDTAVRLCAYRWENVEVTTLSSLLTSANRTLEALREVQRRGGYATPKFCRLVER